MRTDSEIKHRMQETDHFGVRRKEIDRFETDEITRARAIERMPLAWQRVSDHLWFPCAWQSIRYDAWLWRLLGDKDYHQWLTLPYRNYGAPRLLGAAQMLEVAPPTDDRLIRMAHGEPCEDGCTRGCG